MEITTEKITMKSNDEPTEQPNQQATNEKYRQPHEGRQQRVS